MQQVYTVSYLGLTRLENCYVHSKQISLKYLYRLLYYVYFLVLAQKFLITKTKSKIFSKKKKKNLFLP